jgi:MoxR-like ATPase
LKDLRLLIQSRYPILYVETYDEERLGQMLARISRELGMPLFTWSVSQGLEGPGAPFLAETRQPIKLLEGIRERKAPALYLLRDFHPYLKEPGIVRLLREIAQGDHGSLVTVVLCSPAIDLPIELRKVAARYRLELPGEEELRDCVLETFRDFNRTRHLRFGLQEAQLRQFVRSLSGMTLSEARRLVASCLLDDGVLDAADLPRALAAKKEELEESSVLELCAFDQESPTLGGLWRLKEWLRRSQAGFSERARQLGLRPPRGVLLVGVQGCGKSLAAKEIAHEWGVPLARLDPSRLFDKYIGESERNLRTALDAAEAMAPLVLWIDEIEKVFAATGTSESDAGLSRRLFGSFLTWMQEREGAVFVAATANDLSTTPPELLRKGRFDEVFFIDLPSAEARREIFSIHLRLRKQDPKAFALDALAQAAEGFSGAEIEQVVVSSLYGLLAEGGAQLTDERLLAEIRRTVPLSRSSPERVAALRQMARQRFVLVE